MSRELGLTLDAMYIAGYGIECAMKAMILSATPVNQREARFEDEFRGARGHNIKWLLHLWKSAHCEPLSLSMSTELRKVHLIWSTDLRYRAGSRRQSEVDFVIDAAEKIHAWVKERL